MDNNINIARILVFVILSIPVILLSWRSLFAFRSHGFYRFLSWECILWLLVSNFSYWFENPLSNRQIFSWILLFLSVYPVIAGSLLLKRAGKPLENRQDKTLFRFEKTSELVDKGIFRYIRHPLYTSLLLLTWGIFLKHTTTLLFIISSLSTIFLYLTAIFDEKECIEYFGDEYIEYMKRSKRFIPFLF